MKAPDLKKWDLKPEMEGVLFFAQLINELLFDYTIDTYKVPALNTRTLAQELLNSIDDYEKKFLRQGAIKPIILELIDRIKKDPVIKECIKDYFEQFIELLIKETSIPQLKVRVSFLANKIEDKYLPMSKALLKDAILNPKEKEKITRITRNYIVELMDKGYSPEFIYFESEKFFFTGSYPQSVNTPHIIDEYFDLFSAKVKDFNVMYRASKNFNFIKEHADAFRIEICKEVPSLSFRGQSQNVESFLDKNHFCPLFVIVKDNKALDPYKAREDADFRLSFIESLARYHVHRRSLQRSENALVYLNDQRDFMIQKRPNPSVLKRPNRIFQKLSDLVKNTVLTITNKNLDPESFQRLIRALGSHQNAIKSEIPERQLLEFWSAVEVLFPPTIEELDRVDQISKSLTPFISTGYAAKLASDLFTSIKNSGNREALEILNQVPEGSNPIEKCLALFSIETNSSYRDRLFQLFEWHPILRNRIYYLSTKFASANLVLQTLDAHVQRVSWQIQRIYRARNLIIHSGKTLPYINTLVENLHNYLDRALDILNEKVFHSTHLTTIEQIILEVRLSPL